MALASRQSERAHRIGCEMVGAASTDRLEGPIAQDSSGAWVVDLDRTGSQHGAGLPLPQSTQGSGLFWNGTDGTFFRRKEALHRNQQSRLAPGQVSARRGSSDGGQTRSGVEAIL